MLVGIDEMKIIQHCLNVVISGLGLEMKVINLIAFGYVCGMGLEHGYMEDIIVHPQYQGRGMGIELVKELLRESKQFGLRIVTVSYEENKTNFYKSCGFTPGSGGLWLSFK